MGKRTIVLAIVIALSVPVSLIAIAPLFAAQVTKTQPTSKQQTQQPVQTPTIQKIKQSDSKPTAYEKAKDKFWAFEFDHCIIGGTNTRGKDAWDLHIPGAKIGQPLTSTCFYKMKTPPVKDITEADVKAWGTGKSYYILAGFTLTNVPEEVYFKKEENRDLPSFTWEDVKHWLRGGGNDPKIWTEHMVFTWTPAHSVAELWFEVDENKVIPEYDGDDNNNGIFRVFFQQP
jgi:hypothetical protein